MGFEASARRDLVRRVAASAVFRRSPRQRELLLLVCERALAEPSRELRTSEVTAVFARPVLGGALEADNLVRVHMTRLRHRLAEYFAGEGASEPTVIEIPTPGCTPVFRVRTTAARTDRRSVTVVSLAAAAVFFAASGSLALRRADPPALPRAADSASVDRLWAQMFGGRGRVHLLLGTLEGAAQEGPWTSLAEARVAHRVGVLGAAHGLDIEILPAREAGAAVILGGAAILTGAPAVNPWLEPLENQLGFRARSTETAATVFEDVRADEVYRYSPAEGRGYCRVAWVPSLDGSGSLLLVSGTESASAEAGLDLVTRAVWTERLRVALGLRPGDPYPHFEALLATELLGSSAARFELVVARRLAAAVSS